jgi:hypothetical protein
MELASRHKVPLGIVRPALAFGDNVIEGELFVPLAAIGASRLAQGPPHRIVVKDGTPKAPLGFRRSQFRKGM